MISIRRVFSSALELRNDFVERIFNNTFRTVVFQCRNYFADYFFVNYCFNSYPCRIRQLRNCRLAQGGKGGYHL